MVFNSDSTITSEGFVVNYLFIDASKVCGGHYYSPRGVIKSPDYPNYYPSNRNCIWIIETQNKYQIELKIIQFQVEDHNYCSYDYLEIRNGGYDTSPLIGKFCGDQIPRQIMSFTNQIYLKFVSDGSRGDKGFEIEWDSMTYGKYLFKFNIIYKSNYNAHFIKKIYY